MPTWSTWVGSPPDPGPARISVAEELARVLPVVGALADEGVVVSIDTMRAEVARAGCRGRRRLVNDVSGGLADPAMRNWLAAWRCRTS